MTATIPKYMQNSIDNWVNYGCPAPSEMGSFLRAVLTNDLRASVMFADDENRAAIVDWVFYLHNETDRRCHGSREALETWHAHGGLLGRQKAAG